MSRPEHLPISLIILTIYIIFTLQVNYFHFTFVRLTCLHFVTIYPSITFTQCSATFFATQHLAPQRLSPKHRQPPNIWQSLCIKELRAHLCRARSKWALRNERKSYWLAKTNPYARFSSARGPNIRVQEMPRSSSKGNVQSYRSDFRMRMITGTRSFRSRKLVSRLSSIENRGSQS